MVLKISNNAHWQRWFIIWAHMGFGKKGKKGERKKEEKERKKKRKREREREKERDREEKNERKMERKKDKRRKENKAVYTTPVACGGRHKKNQICWGDKRAPLYLLFSIVP